MTRLFRSAGILATSVALVITLAVPALSHVVYQQLYTVHYDGSKCVWQKAEVSDGNEGKGYFFAATQSKIDYLGMRCYERYNQNVGHIRVNAKIYMWSSINKVWVYCAETGVFKNGAVSYKRDIAMAPAPCGFDEYRTKAVGAVYENGQWHGDSLWTNGSHFVG